MRRTRRSYLPKLLLCLLLVAALLGQGAGALAADGGDLRVRNLQKLCKVWGYAKYTHPAFLLGQRDWDAELLDLIEPVAGAESAEAADGILYDWVAGLGEVDYGTDTLPPNWAEADKNVQADTDWTSDTAYLGEELAAALSQLREIPVIYRGKGPVQFSNQSAVFLNEKSHGDMDFGDARYRLLGLFRLWNAMEYYFPYLDLLDDDWDALLLRYIPIMLEGGDRQSYELTLAAIAAQLHDAHVWFADGAFLEEEFGAYIAPVWPARAEGRWVVEAVFDAYTDDCPLLPGDVLLRLNGVKMEEVAAHRKKYLSVPNDEKLAAKLEYYLLRSHEKTIGVTVLRDGAELTVSFRGMHAGLYRLPEVTASHELLDGNIGLINPAALSANEIPGIMREFADTDGLIVDLRQYPSDPIMYSLAEYLLDARMPYATATYPSQTAPGVFLKWTLYSGSANGDFYEKPVVILMSEHTASQPEFTVMSLRNGPNVVVMGENSIGADGNVTRLPLPGGNAVQFSGLGIFTPGGGQTQRIGLSPDIRVERTIAGVREGRDELMEAAIRYILGAR